MKVKGGIVIQYRKDNKSGNEISILGFGCMRLPGGANRIDKEKTEKLILEAYKKGINYYDTAYLYFGSEEAIGAIFEKHNIREKIYIATKLPQILCKTSDDFDKFFNIQKKRLSTNYIDYYLIHNIAELRQWEKMCQLGIKEWINKKKASGEIRQIGFSFHGTRDDFILMLDAFEWDFVQIQYNYINTNYQAGTHGLMKAAEKGIPVFIMEPLLGGKLVTGLPKEAVELMKNVQPNSTPASWALKWIWNHPEVTMVLSGMNEELQLEENIKLASESVPKMFTEKENQTIESVIEIFNKSYKIHCTGCNYCMPCPKKINIPACFTAYNTSYAVGRGTGISEYMRVSGSLSEEVHLVSDCVECGKCEKHCPQGIEIRKSLKYVKRRLQFPGMKVVGKVARRIIR